MKIWRWLRRNRYAVALAAAVLAMAVLFLLVGVCLGEPVVPAPPLQAIMNPDHTLSVPFPSGIAAIRPQDIEWNPDGSIRFNWVENGIPKWAIYVPPFTVQVGTGPGPIPIKPTITTASIAKGSKGAAYTQTFAAAGGAPPYLWTVTGTVPGLTFTPAGVLAGTPTLAAEFPLLVQVADSKGQVDSRQFSLQVTEPPVPPVPSKVRVLVLYDPAQKTMTEPQRQMIASEQPGSLRAWCKANCLKDSAGLAEMRIWPLGMDQKTVPERWKPLVIAGAAQPGLVVQAGETGSVTRLILPPDNAAAIVALDAIAKPRGPPLVIDESNYRQFVGVRPTGYIKSDQPSGLPKFREVYPVIPRSQWQQLVKEGKGTFLSDLIKAAKIPSKDQDGLGYCWIYASTSTVETIRALQGQPFVSLSPESAGGPIKNWRNEGGWGTEALKQLMTVGACADSFMDRPNSLSPGRWKAGWQADCANHKITAAWASIDDGDFDAVFTAALLRLPVSIGLDWWGHQVQTTDPVVLGANSYGVLFRNSWGASYGDDGWATLTESRAQPSGSFACVSVGASDREMNATTRGTAVDLVRLRQQRVAETIHALAP